MTNNWHEKTPPECDYRLEMMGPDSAEETIEISRQEYVELKRRLAELRGIEHKLREQEEQPC